MRPVPSLPDPAHTVVLIVFAVVYLGMILGGLPRLHLDRTGVALLGAIALIGAGVMGVEDAARAVHLPTILLLFSFMVISAQMRLGGFYDAVTRWVGALPWHPAALLGLVVVIAAGLSAVFTNDIVCLAMAPVLVGVCLRRRLDPVPFLLGLACASNIGSAATLIGNPQNILIGEVLRMDFAAYTQLALVPVLLGCAVLWAWLAWPMRHAAARVVDGARAAVLEGGGAAPSPVAQPTDAALSSTPTPADAARPLATEAAEAGEATAFDRWQTTKGLAVVAVLMVVFLATGLPRDVAALVGAGVLLLSQRFHSSRVMGLVDWELLVLFMGLFVVNAALQQTGLAADAMAALQARGLDLREGAALFAGVLVLGNVVSNVPAVMLLLPAAQQAADPAQAGAILALASTLAGNLLLVGSIANLIVVDAARRAGIVIDWRQHARTGIPVTVLTLALAAGWLAMIGT